MKSSTMLLSDQDLAAEGAFDEHPSTLTPTSIVHGYSEPSISHWAWKQVAPMLRMHRNWDGYKADPPRYAAVEQCARLLTVIETNFGQQHPIVSPTRTGGVMLIWNANSRELELHFNPPKPVAFVLENTVTGATLSDDEVPFSSKNEALADALIQFFTPKART